MKERRNRPRRKQHSRKHRGWKSRSTLEEVNKESRRPSCKQIHKHRCHGSTSKCGESPEVWITWTVSITTKKKGPGQNHQWIGNLGEISDGKKYVRTAQNLSSHRTFIDGEIKSLTPVETSTPWLWGRGVELTPQWGADGHDGPAEGKPWKYMSPPMPYSGLECKMWTSQRGNIRHIRHV